MLFNSLE